VGLIKQPVSRIEWRDPAELSANDYNPNRVHKPEWRLLEHSILTTGWVQPILVDRDLNVIDGFHRWRMAQDSKKVAALTDGKVPVAVLDVDRPAAMLMTIRMNRAKGSHVAVSMSKIVKELVEEHGLAPAAIAEGIGGTLDEVNTLLMDNIFELRGISSWRYSNAWYPADVPADEAPAEDAIPEGEEAA
jgi:ParB-like chromosome segregation protein Spo0J